MTFPSPTKAPRTIASEPIVNEPPAQRKPPFQDIKNEVNSLASRIESSYDSYELKRLAVVCDELARQVAQRPDVIEVRPQRVSVNCLVSAYRILAEAAQWKYYFANNRYMPVDQRTRESTNRARNAVLEAIADEAVAPVQ